MLRVLNRFMSAGRRAHGQEAFRWTMQLAAEVKATNPHALHKLIGCLLRPEMYAGLRGVVEAAPHRAPEAPGPFNFFNGGRGGPGGVDVALHSLRHRIEVAEETVDLANDIVFAGPWERRRFGQAISHIGRKCRGADWCEDPLNHAVELWLPWRIAIVTGGNHSIASGILGLEGSLKPRDVFDYAPVFQNVRCDGRRYRWCPGGGRVEDVFDHRRAAVFEIGRMMVG